MKRFLLSCLAVVLLGSAGFAQTTPKKNEKAATTVKTAEAKKETKETARAATGQTGPLKKDGTPDKRYKENKGQPTAKHVKKDGTPDKRYKENKKH